MINPTIPKNEIQRLSNLKDYMIMDTIPESDFDEITMLASQICDTPISLVSLVDDKRQWFKSRHGLDVLETPRDLAFCGHAINHPRQAFIVPDSRLDNRFHDNPLVTGSPHVVFYAGIPLLTPEGNALGTLCVIDNHPKELNERQITSLKALSHQVMCQLELRRKNTQLSLTYQELINNYNDIEQFASIAAHDLRSPLHNITALIDYFLDENAANVTPDGVEYLNHIKTSSLQLTRLIDAILAYSKSTQVIITSKERFNLTECIAAIIQLLKPPAHIAINYPQDDVYITTSRVAIKQVLLNLINNAVKYNDKQGATIDITFHESEEDYHFTIKDNGPGIPEKHLDSIFDLFKTVKTNANSGTGIGLSIVKRLVKKLHGDITVVSKKDIGTQFTFNIKK
ncbi:histidine kinase [Flavipsychrobacter stenotrophus]|uniref:histidine kinase n=1 Tax=Flavipsychrobacter stenotrophus TaxID=2077091 RepID=A0A2S7STT7_9BACT|nr:GAF domain-containing sensor histidine kinase [Flavipsychrobacter stenotrophus]PQJ10148.1 histidine kinase [Flavipsychrobacter stenotrophus]